MEEQDEINKRIQISQTGEPARIWEEVKAAFKELGNVAEKYYPSGKALLDPWQEFRGWACDQAPDHPFNIETEVDLTVYGFKTRTPSDWGKPSRCYKYEEVHITYDLLVEWYKEKQKEYLQYKVDEEKKQQEFDEALGITGVKPGLNIEKIKWLGTPAQFGYILRELADRGYIAEPQSKGKESNAAYARLLLQHFEVNGKPRTIEHELNRNQNSLTETRLIKIPDQKSL